MMYSSEFASPSILAAIVGDSATGKTTLSKGIARILGIEQVAILCTDGYHRYNREQRKQKKLTPLNPACNHLDILAQHVSLLHSGHPILMPSYDHERGDFGPPIYVAPRPFMIIEGLLGLSRQEIRDAHSVRIYLDPPERQRRLWKLQRDTTRRGYTQEEVLQELDRRELDAATYIRPQRYYADIVVSFFSNTLSQQQEDHHTPLSVTLTLSGTLHHPDLSAIIAEDASGCVHSTLSRECGRPVEHVTIDGSLPARTACLLAQGLLYHLKECGWSPSPSWYQDEPAHKRNYPLLLTQLFLACHLLQAQQHVAAGQQAKQAAIYHHFLLRNPYEIAAPNGSALPGRRN